MKKIVIYIAMSLFLTGCIKDPLPDGYVYIDTKTMLRLIVGNTLVKKSNRQNCYGISFIEKATGEGIWENYDHYSAFWPCSQTKKTGFAQVMDREELTTGLIAIPLRFRKQVFSDYVSYNHNKKIIRIANGEDYVELYIKNGIDYNLLKKFKNGNYDNVAANGIISTMILNKVAAVIKDISNTPINKNYSHCGASDTCYKTIKMKKTSAIIECTKGTRIGQELCIGVNKSGKWASGCGFVDVAAHHYNYSKAANIACGQ